MISQVAEDALLVTLGEEIDEAATPRIAAFSREVRERFAGEVLDVVPSYTTVMVVFDPLATNPWCLSHALKSVLEDLPPADPVQSHSSTDSRLIELPVWYDIEAGPDLQALARACHLSEQQVIEKHCGKEYRVFAMGFAPGFGFLGKVDPAIAHPRKETPRKQVAAGSVGIAGVQTAVYPLASPGGWQLIGRCPTTLFDARELSLLQVGDRVRFHAISREDYLALGGTL